MYTQLLKHYWLKSVRAPGYYKNLIVNIFVGITMLYFLVFFVFLGFILPRILEEVVPG